MTSFRGSPPENQIPYSNQALRQDLHRVQNAWSASQSSRERHAIFGYLSAVYDLVSWWAAEGRDHERARLGLLSRRTRPFAREDPFATVIRCTADPQKVDKRTRSKWAGLMRYATDHKLHAE